MVKISCQLRRAYLAGRLHALALITSSAPVLATTEQAPPRPDIEIVDAINLANGALATTGMRSSYSIVRVWFVSGSKKEEARWMIVCRLGNMTDNKHTKKWIMIEVGATGKAVVVETIPDWATTVSQVLDRNPRVDVKNAISSAIQHAATRNELSNFYIDRVWLGDVVGKKEQKWVVSFSPDNERDPTAFWFKVSVDMLGKAADSNSDVKWLNREGTDAIPMKKGSQGPNAISVPGDPRSAPPQPPEGPPAAKPAHVPKQ